jgi:hypothetical protein
VGSCCAPRLARKKPASSDSPLATSPDLSIADPDDEHDERLPERARPYSIVNELGRGGMGTVYLAEPNEPGLRKPLRLEGANASVPALRNALQGASQLPGYRWVLCAMLRIGPTAAWSVGQALVLASKVYS